ncbi:hypothetical protein IB223_14560 [Pseudoxanthomonas sp. PXM03]|uniref:hypothetical protein n=1 Tax=Pseudoxanthomonas sp. PXM03 TaxID=2769284 RepID=UPI00178134E3|nr:hypothetical protein [Pseudoxanthomonas sp. PXM03]MBD9437322.1 hypothetical protein [Pseudoxanthomonas sp. PXM03]
MHLFDAPRERFLRVLHGKYRAIAACTLVELHEQFFGPTSDSVTLTLDSLRQCLAAACDHTDVYAASEDDTAAIFSRAPTEMEREEAIRLLSRLLVEDGWLERYFADLKPALRFTRAGKLVAAALTEITRPRRRTRLRNMRSVRNALLQFYERADPDDLADALHYAAAMSDELTDDIHMLQEQARSLLRQQDTAFDHLLELNRRMDGDYAPRLLADNVDTYSSDIIDALEKLRALPDARRTEMDRQLSRELPWLAEDAAGHHRVLDYALDRVHTIILHGCRPKQSAMVREIQSVTRLMAQVVGHQHFVRAASRSSALSRLVERLKEEESPEQRERLLARFGHAIAPMAIRLVDPSRIAVRDKRASRVASGEGSSAIISWDAQLQHAIEQALDSAVMIDAPANGAHLANQLRERHAVYFSDLALDSPQAILHAVFAMAHANEVIQISAENLPHRPVVNAFFSTHDVLMTPSVRRPLKEPYATDP